MRRWNSPFTTNYLWGHPLPTLAFAWTAPVMLTQHIHTVLCPDQVKSPHGYPLPCSKRKPQGHLFLHPTVKPLLVQGWDGPLSRPLLLDAFTVTEVSLISIPVSHINAAM